MAEGSEKKERRTPRDVLRVVFRRRWLFLLGSSLFAIGALVGSHWLEVKYTGTAKFERRSDVAARESLQRSSESFEAIKLTLQHELAGRGAVERIADDLGLTRGLPRDQGAHFTDSGELQKQEIVRKLMKDIKVRWEVRSEDVDLVSVSVTHSDRRLAREIPDVLVKNYITRVSEQIVQRLTDSRDFLLKQVRACTTRATELNNKKIQFETRHAGMMPDSPGALQERIQQISADIDARQLQQNTARQTLARLKALGQAATAPASQPATQPAEPVQVVRGPNPELRRLEEQLRAMEEALTDAQMLNHMKDNHPTVVKLRAKIRQLRKTIKNTPAEAVLHRVYGNAASSDALRPQLAATESLLETATREIERLERRRAAWQKLMGNFAPVRQEYLQIIEKIQKQEAELGNWQGRLTEVEMALAAEVAKRRTHLNAVQAAQRQLRPSSPSLVMILGFAIFGGLAFGGGLVFGAQFLDRTIATTEHAMDYFDVPVHGVIGEIVTRRQRAAARLKRWLVAPVVSLIIVACLCISGLSVVLWLRFPEKYEQWRASPAGFVYRTAAEAAGAPLERP